MRICHYPGRAVDATLSLDQKNPLDTVYQNNWLNADQTIRTISKSATAAASTNGSNGSGSPNNNSKSKNINHAPASNSPLHSSSGSEDDNRRNSISSLGKYQVTLEQMRKLDLNQPNELFQKTMRNLNGYKPSTLRQKNRRNYTGWDDFREINATNDESSKKSVDQRSSINGTIRLKKSHNRMDMPDTNGWNGSNSGPYGNGNHTIRLIPKIKRSQTVRYSTPNESKLLPTNANNNLDLKNMFNHKNGDNVQGEMKASYPTATINKSFTNRLKRSNLLAIQKSFNSMPNVDKDHEIQNGHIAHNTNSNGQNDDFNRNKSIGSQGISKIQENGKPYNYNTMGYYNGDADNGNGNNKKDITIEKNELNSKKNGKSILRVKSVRINLTPFEDVNFNKRYYERSMDSDGDIKSNNTKKQQQCDKQQIDNKSYRNNPIIVQGNFQQLPRLAPIIKQKANVIQTNKQQVLFTPLSQQQPTTPVNIRISEQNGLLPNQKSHKQQLRQSVTTSVITPNTLRKSSSTSSLSSTPSSGCDCNSNVSDFSIPRPRLIVPVHTYARKRRTGNLIQNPNQNDYNNDTVVVEQPRNPAAYQQQFNKKNNGKLK